MEPAKNHLVEIILSTIYALVFFLIIRKFDFYRIIGAGKNPAYLLFIAKLVAGISLGLVYTYFYTDRHTADTFRLFDDSAIVFRTLSNSPEDFFSIMTGIGGNTPHLEGIYNQMHNWYDIYSPVNDNRFMIRLNTLLRFFSFGYYYVHVVFVAFLSFTGTIALIRLTTRLIPDSGRTLYLILGFLPSVLFWGSGLMKDAVVIFALGMTLYYFEKAMRPSGDRFALLKLLLALCLLTFSRFQILAVIFPGLAGWFCCARFQLRPIIAFPFTVILFLVFLFLFPGHDLPALLYAKQQSFLKLATDAGAGSLIDPIAFQPDFMSVLIHAPVGFITAFTRPFITDGHNALMMLSAAENTFLLIFGLFSVRYASIKTPITMPVFWFSALFVIISFSLIGLVSPVLGAIVRYKTPALPFLLIALLLLLRSDKRRAIEQSLSKFHL